MTALDQWRALLADIEAAMGPFDMRKADALAGGLKLGLEFESIDLLLTGLQAGTEALGAVVALVEREWPAKTIEMTCTTSVCRAEVWNAHTLHNGTAGRGDTNLALALLAAFARAKVAGLEAAA